MEDNITLIALTKGGYTFDGWYSGNNKITSISSGTYGDLELTAKWKLIVYNIYYENTMGADVSGFTQNFHIETPNVILPDINVEHYVFEGWFTANGRRMIAIPKGSFGNITLSTGSRST